jgi:hypothetical protein
LPGLAFIERNQQVAMKPDESLSPSLLTFSSRFAAIHRHSYYDFMTEPSAKQPSALVGEQNPVRNATIC